MVRSGKRVPGKRVYRNPLMARRSLPPDPAASITADINISNYLKMGIRMPPKCQAVISVHIQSYHLPDVSDTGGCRGFIG